MRSVCSKIVHTFFVSTTILAVPVPFLGLPTGSTALADELVRIPVADATLMEDEFGSISNGGGGWLFAGKTSGFFTRRAMLRFDLTPIPRGSTITRVQLRLRLDRTLDFENRVMKLHRLTASWSEGGGNPTNNEGSGVPTVDGDCTWLHRTFPNDLWTTPGGDFEPMSSATSVFGFIEPRFDSFDSNATTGTFGNPNGNPGLIADVTAWVNNPSINFGWILRGYEDEAANARRFVSRTGATANRPTLTITYTPAPTGCNRADIVGIGGLPPADGLLTGDDFISFINAFAVGDVLADVARVGGGTPPDGLLTGDDFVAFIAAFAAGCP
jgi:hypothetical protein